MPTKQPQLYLFLLPMLIACPGRIDDPDRFVAEVDCLSYIPIFIEQSCSQSGCHSSIDQKGELDLESEGVADRLIDQEAAGPRCDEGILLDLNDLEGSLMYSKLLDSPTCGDTMPLFSRPSSQFELDCMLEWLSSLNPDSEPPDDSNP